MLTNLLLNLGIWLISLKGGETVVAIYVALIVAGRRKYENIPTGLKDDVKADLEAIGLGTDGKPTV